MCEPEKGGGFLGTKSAPKKRGPIRGSEKKEAGGRFSRKIGTGDVGENVEGATRNQTCGPVSRKSDSWFDKSMGRARRFGTIKGREIPIKKRMSDSAGTHRKTCGPKMGHMDVAISGIFFGGAVGRQRRPRSARGNGGSNGAIGENKTRARTKREKRAPIFWRAMRQKFAKLKKEGLMGRRSVRTERVPDSGISKKWRGHLRAKKGAVVGENMEAETQMLGLRKGRSEIGFGGD